MKNVYRILSASILFLFSSLLFSQTKDINFALKGLDEYIEKVMKEWKIPGLAISIVKDSEVVYSKGFGYRNVQKKLKVTPNTLFAIASCSKAFTATSMGILVDEKKLDLDKPVRDYLPTLKLSDDYITEHIIPRDLVTHRAGLSRNDDIWWRSPFTRKEIFNKLKYLEFNKGFRQSYQYNNLMFLTAGVLVEEISGGSWESFVENKILKPLEMNNTNFSVHTSQKSADYSLPYREIKDKVQEFSFCDADALGPAGSINSNISDMSNWVIMNLNKGKFKGKQIISESILKQIHSPQFVSSTTQQYDEIFYSTYGMGWGITSYRGNLMISHTGSLDGFRALVTMLPKEKLGIVILVNLGYSPKHSAIAYKVYDRYLGLPEVDWFKRYMDEEVKDKEKVEKAKAKGDTVRKLNTKPTHPLESLTGKYEHPAYGIVKIEKDGEKLKASFNNRVTPLSHYHYNIFVADDEEMFDKEKFTFVVNNKGEIDRVTVPFEPTIKDIVFTRTK